MKNTALIVVDMQEDFMPEGALPVQSARTTLPTIELLMHDISFRVWTQDWHPQDHKSFVEQGGPWPVHCVGGTNGAKIVPELLEKIGQPNSTGSDIFWRKAYRRDVDAYSPFKDELGTVSELGKLLRDNGITTLYVCGVATEYCVRATVLDALDEGFKVVVVANAIAGVDETVAKIALDNMQLHGAKRLWYMLEA